MADRYLLDTDIIIEYLRGAKKAIEFVEGLSGELILSAITVAELWAGIKDYEEERSLNQFLLAFEVVGVDENITKRGGLLRREYRSTHGTGLVDALIAATAEREQAQLITFNVRHYPMVSDVKMPYEK